jgi:hypothetical protein
MFRSSAGGTKTGRKRVQHPTFPLHPEIYAFLALAPFFSTGVRVRNLAMERREKDENIVDSIKASPKGLATLEAHSYCKPNSLFLFLDQDNAIEDFFTSVIFWRNRMYTD